MIRYIPTHSLQEYLDFIDREVARDDKFSVEMGFPDFITGNIKRAALLSLKELLELHAGMPEPKYYSPGSVCVECNMVLVIKKDERFMEPIQFPCDTFVAIAKSLDSVYYG